MRKVLCWLLGHDSMKTRSSHRVCLRCGLREALRHLGHVDAWEEVTGVERHR